MQLTDYIYTPTDVVRGFKQFSWWQLAATVVSIPAYIGLRTLVSSDLAFLVSGLLFMSFPRIPFRLPLLLAVAGLLILMATSPFADDGSRLEDFAESVAVGVFFMLIFGVYRMIVDEAVGSR